MAMTTTELAIVGAGPAGLAATLAAAKAGVHVTLLDEYPRPGGQYLQGASNPDAPPPASTTERKGRALLNELNGLNKSRVDLRAGTLVWGIEPEGGKSGTGDLRLALHGPQGPDRLQARAVIVATGARELVIPFPGWTLPGVMTLGGAHLLAKAHGTLPGRRVLLAGSGPLLFPVAHEFIRQGAEVVAVLEATHPSAWLRHAPALWGQWDRLREGWTYWRAMARAGVPYRFRHAVMRALGEGGLEAAVVARLDRHGFPVPGSQETIPVDALCLGFGFVPNVGLTQLAGCTHQFDPARGGWVPLVNERQGTTVPGLFAAGETTGVDGAAAATLEGHVAGLAAAQQLGHVSESKLGRESAALAPRRRRLRRFGTMLNTLFIPPPGLEALTTDETPICRCEEVSVGEIRKGIRQGADELDALKTWTRVGQGPCQGRTCGPLLARLIARETGRPPADAGTLHVRPPLKPLPLGALANFVSEPRPRGGFHARAAPGTGAGSVSENSLTPKEEL